MPSPRKPAGLSGVQTVEIISRRAESSNRLDSGFGRAAPE